MSIHLSGALAVVMPIACLSACSGSTSAPSSNALHAEVTDPAGDAVASPGTPNPPDLIHGTVDVGGGNITFAIQFAAGTLDKQTTRLTIELDTDQNSSSGITGASGVGIDYVLDLWNVRTPPTLVQQATPATCSSGGSCYNAVGSGSLNIGSDTMTATVALSALGNTSGRLNYRVFAYAFPQGALPTVVADVMPDINLPPAHVP